MGKLKIKEAAAVLGLHPNTLRMLDRRGIFLASRSPNGYRSYALSDLLQLRKDILKNERIGQELGRKLTFISARGAAHE